jgi:hypothetical protein
MPADDISTETVHDTQLGVSYPARAVIWVDDIYCFEASEPADWRAVLRRAGIAGGTILIPDNGTPGDAWCEADLRLARMVRCSCGDTYLDPDKPDAFAVYLCEPCYQQAGWENYHSDNSHDHQPDPGNCPLCEPHSWYWADHNREANADV